MNVVVFGYMCHAAEGFSRQTTQGGYKCPNVSDSRSMAKYFFAMIWMLVSVEILSALSSSSSSSPRSALWLSKVLRGDALGG